MWTRAAHASISSYTDMNTLQPSSAEERKRKASIVKPLLRRVTPVTALFYAFTLDIYNEKNYSEQGPAVFAF